MLAQGWGEGWCSGGPPEPQISAPDRIDSHLPQLPISWPCPDFNCTTVGTCFTYSLLLFTRPRLLVGAGVQNLGSHLESWITSGDGLVLQVRKNPTPLGRS